MNPDSHTPTGDALGRVLSGGITTSAGSAKRASPQAKLDSFAKLASWPSTQPQIPPLSMHHASPVAWPIVHTLLRRGRVIRLHTMMPCPRSPRQRLRGCRVIVAPPTMPIQAGATKASGASLKMVYLRSAEVRRVQVSMQRHGGMRRSQHSPVSAATRTTPEPPAPAPP